MGLHNLEELMWLAQRMGLLNDYTLEDVAQSTDVEGREKYVDVGSVLEVRIHNEQDLNDFILPKFKMGKAASKQLLERPKWPDPFHKPNYTMVIRWTASFNMKLYVIEPMISEFSYVIDKGPSPKIFSRVNEENIYLLTSKAIRCIQTMRSSVILGHCGRLM